jgi:methyltransferase (TIGR00027 family)
MASPCLRTRPGRWALSSALRDTSAMAKSGRSRTAQGVAAERAVLTDMGVLEDSLAAQMLRPSMGAVVSLVRLVPDKMRTRSVTLAGLAGRVLWFDQQVAEAIEAGLKQIVVVGAGHDSRAWRFGCSGVQFYELDHSGTQREKARRAPEGGPKYIESDLNKQSAAEALVTGGFDESRPSLFIIEGVSMYLDEAVVQRQLGALGQIAAVGSRMVIDFQPPRDTGSQRNRRQLRLQRIARIGSGEGFRLVIDRAEAVELVQECGWEVISAISMRQAAGDLVRRDTGLHVNSINEKKTLVAAIRS